MKTKSHILVAGISSFLILNSAFGQGSLTPPGAPGPTMLTLSQMEPRTPISSAPFTITQPGSYYLTTNLTISTGNAITIATNAVRLDLNGFTISSTAASASGSAILINTSSARNLTILNGFIQGGVTNNGSNVYSGGGFQFGIFYSASAPVNTVVARISVSGCLDYGIYTAGVVESCTVTTTGSEGINASVVRGCSAVDCGFSAILASVVSDSTGVCTGSGYGIDASAVQNSSGSCIGNSGSGIIADTAQNCYGYTAGNGYGVYATTTANGCYGYSYSGTGVFAFIANICHGATYSGTALSATHNVNSF